MDPLFAYAVDDLIAMCFWFTLFVVLLGWWIARSILRHLIELRKAQGQEKRPDNRRRQPRFFPKPTPQPQPTQQHPFIVAFNIHRGD